MQNPGAILAFTYTGEGAGEVTEDPRNAVSEAKPSGSEEPARASGHTGSTEIAPQFTAAQAAAGKTAYNSSCAVCHGSTMTNGTFGTPLAGAYFKNAWFGKTVAKFYERAQKTMPPAAPASLPKESYANIVAYILDMNGFKAGDSPLPAGGGEALDSMTIK